MYHFTEEQQAMKRRDWTLATALRHYSLGRIDYRTLWEVYFAYGYPAECAALRDFMLRVR